MKNKKTITLSALALFILTGALYFAAVARNPASESANYQLPAQALPAIAGLSTSPNYTLFHSGGEALGGGQEGASESFGLRSGFWLGGESNGTAPGPIYLPIAVRAIPCFTGSEEIEPNDGSATATGPLCLNQNYLGTPDDNWDFFSFTLNSPGVITIDVTNHPLASENGAQVQLYYQTVSPGAKVGEAIVLPYQIIYDGAAGTYYVVIFNDIDKCDLVNCSVQYTLRISD